MNKIKYTIASLLIVGTLVQCDALVGDPELPIPLEETMANTGAFLRVLAVTSSGFDVADLNTAKYEFLGEIQDVNDGQDIDKVDFYVAYKASGQQAGAEPSSPIASYDAANFTIQDASGLPGSVFSIKLVDILSYLNLDVNTLDLGDEMEIRWEVILKDGTVYTKKDASPAVTGGFYKSPYFARASVVSSIPENVYVGEYTVTKVSGGSGILGTSAIFSDGPSNFGAFVMELGLDPNDTKNGRIASVCYLPNFGCFGMTLPLTFFRKQDFGTFGADDNWVSTPGSVGSGVGCGLNLDFDQIVDPDQSGFDVSDDSSFSFILEDNKNGDCGGAPTPAIFSAVKN
jgi:hypothetical protein